MLLIYKKSITIKKCDTSKIKICPHRITMYERNGYCVLDIAKKFVIICYSVLLL